MLKPPKLEDLPYGTTLISGMGVSTIVADFDFETYSASGFVWDTDKNKFLPLPYAKVKGLPCVGTAAYSEHDSTQVLCLAYNLKDGEGPKLCVPSLNHFPQDLFEYIAQGKLIESWNILFEKWIWDNVCVKKYGWPELPLYQLRCAMAKARAFNLPGSLAKAAEILNKDNKKDKQGARLIKKFSIPRDPTQKDLRKRVLLTADGTDLEDFSDSQLLYGYCIQDIATEAELSSKIPDLNDFELKVWQADLKINLRGVQIDIDAVNNFVTIIEQAKNKYNQTIQQITKNCVQTAYQVLKIKKWAKQEFNLELKSLDEKNTEILLRDENLPNDLKKVIQLRSLINASSVAKLYTIKNQISKDGRLHNLFNYHGARTGRATASGTQPQNLPNSGPEQLYTCLDCNKYFTDTSSEICYLSGSGSKKHDNVVPAKWDNSAIEQTFNLSKSKSLDVLELYYADAIAAISGCLRGVFIAKPEHVLIGSDYSSIEAIVLAELAGETWRQEVFRTHGKIYEMSASKITGVPFEEFTKHKETTGQHHPLRNKLGKIAELASGYGGWIGAWKNFGADKILSEDEIKSAILNWRKASPNIVKFWGGQYNNYRQKELFGLEGCAIAAVMSPGKEFSYNSISYVVKSDILFCKLPSGRYLTYHKPRLSASEHRFATLVLSYNGYNTNPKYGTPGAWVRMHTYGGKLTENVVQAVARDILVHAIVNLEKSGFPVVLHVHDEIISEVPANRFSVEQFESIMNEMPEWAKNWPIKASNGWQGRRYNK